VDKTMQNKLTLELSDLKRMAAAAEAEALKNELLPPLI